MKLYREVRIETADDLDQLEEYYVKETSPVGAWQIVLVPIEAEEVRSEDYGSYHLVESLTATAPFTVYVPQEDQ